MRVQNHKHAGVHCLGIQMCQSSDSENIYSWWMGATVSVISRREGITDIQIIWSKRKGLFFLCQYSDRSTVGISQCEMWRTTTSKLNWEDKNLNMCPCLGDNVGNINFKAQDKRRKEQQGIIYGTIYICVYNSIMLK